MGAIRGVPHPFPYQGSKRKLAGQIIACIPSGIERLVEPFAGSAAITLAAAYRRRANHFLINDIHEPLIDLWNAIIHHPHRLIALYQSLWNEQSGRERVFYDEIRDEFNRTHCPHCFLYLLARCVKAAVRYNGKGQFNNSPDNRRKGMHPDTMERNIIRTSELLNGRTEVSCRDYEEVLDETTCDDVVYMDPPYQGVCGGRDQRYCQSIEFGQFAESLRRLNERDVPFIVSYDGRTGSKVYGRDLPDELGLIRTEILVGRSTQATLLGRDHHTFESLYLSPSIMERLGSIPKVLRENHQKLLFA
ncbi:MAG: DNA adenine methylase [Planctomycetota bacterium]|nr:DNA adenine methylase [Planctomycetota bacterium]